MIDRRALSEATCRVAEAWRDPEYPRRAKAEEDMLEIGTRCTVESLAFATNQVMANLASGAFIESLDADCFCERKRVGVIHRSSVPFEEIRDWLLVLALGHSFIGLYDAQPPPMLSAFAREVAELADGCDQQFLQIDTHHGSLDILIGTDELLSVFLSKHQDVRSPENHGIAFVKNNPGNVAILTGKEKKEDCMGLAEDVLLHEGLSSNNVRILWAPKELNPDPYLEAFALFRGTFPAHERTPGTLQMQKAFLDAQDVPHAYGDGLEFLVSKGDPVQQQPGHLRWATYDALDEVVAWMEEKKSDIQCVIGGKDARQNIGNTIPVRDFGSAHRLSLAEYPDTAEMIHFLCPSH